MALGGWQQLLLVLAVLGLLLRVRGQRGVLPQGWRGPRVQGNAAELCARRLLPEPRCWCLLGAHSRREGPSVSWGRC